MAEDEGPRARPQGDPEVGSLGEEAARLLGALSEWAREQGGDYGHAASGAARGVADAIGQVNDHLATGSQDCRYCPLCQVIHVVRETSPEVRDHLTSAAHSLLQAAASLLDTPRPRSQSETPRTPDRGSAAAERRRHTPVEKIDLDGTSADDGSWE